MSWSTSMIGRPADIERALKELSEKLTGQCKAEFDDAMPHLLGLVKENFCMSGSAPFVRLSASGGGWAEGGKQNQRSLSASIEPYYGVVLGATAQS